MADDLGIRDSDQMSMMELFEEYEYEDRTPDPSPEDSDSRLIDWATLGWFPERSTNHQLRRQLVNALEEGDRWLGLTFQQRQVAAEIAASVLD